MKKTCTVNIANTIFNIDEDAYDILKAYLDSVKKYFHKIDDQNEIINDFELRIAENFLTKIKNKNVIDLNDVKNMIKIMGTLEDFEEISDNDKNEEEQDNQQKDNGKLYRDSSNRIIAGVCSGIAQYFKIDPIIVRVIFFIAAPLQIIVYLILWFGIPSKDFDPNLRKILFRDKENGIIGGVAKGLSNYLKMDVNLIRVFFFGSLFFGGAGLLFYLLLWFFTKEAKTIGQKMNMSGFNVNLSNIEDFIKKKTKNLNSPESTLTKIFLFPFRLLAPLINAVWNIGVFIFKTIFFIIITTIVVTCGILLLILLSNLYNEISADQAPVFYEFLNAIPDYFIITTSWSLVFTIVISFLIAVYVLFNKKSNPYIFMLLVFLWIGFLTFNTLSIPAVIIQMQNLDILPDWITGFEYNSFYYKWNY